MWRLSRYDELGGNLDKNWGRDKEGKPQKRQGKGTEKKKRVTGDRKCDKSEEMGTGNEKHISFLQSAILHRSVLPIHCYYHRFIIGNKAVPYGRHPPEKKTQAPHHLADAFPSASAGETQARHFGSDTDGVEVPLRRIKGNQYGEVHIGMAYFYGTLKVWITTF